MVDLGGSGDAHPSQFIYIFIFRQFSKWLYGSVTTQCIFTYVIYRGNWYWDSEERIKPDVQHYYCDREHKLEEHCPELMELLNTVEKFEAVIDFSSFGGFQVNDSVKVLTVNISTYKDI